MIQTLQAAIDLAWDYTDDPDECQALSDANKAIEALQALIAKAKSATTVHQALLVTERNTGYLDADQMHGIEDDCVAIAASLAAA